MNVLLTGGLGYIGSHTAVELDNNGHNAIIVDDLSRSSTSTYDRITKITGHKLELYIDDLMEEGIGLSSILDNKLTKDPIDKIDSIIHFAGFKSIPESIKNPLEYYQNNLVSTLSLLKVMKSHNIKNLIVSSSASVYGNAEVPITEDSPRQECINPYGWTKWMIEQILMDFSKAHPDWSITILRYFNPIGAHESGLLGENPSNKPDNLLPYVAKVANGQLPEVHVFGDDYPTKDGTGVRDYIHIMDLANAHVVSVEKSHNKPGLHIYNVGTGHGCSVLDVIHTYEKVTNCSIKYVIDPRRDGDVAVSYCDPSKINNELGWYAKYDLTKMIEDADRWTKSLLKSK